MRGEARPDHAGDSRPGDGGAHGCADGSTHARPYPEPTPSPYELTSPVYDETKLAPFMLVNFEHECRCIGDAETQLVELHGNTPASLLLTNNDHRLNSEAVPALSAFADAFTLRPAATACS